MWCPEDKQRRFVVFLGWKYNIATECSRNKASPTQQNGRTGVATEINETPMCAKIRLLFVPTDLLIILKNTIRRKTICGCVLQPEPKRNSITADVAVLRATTSRSQPDPGLRRGTHSCPGPTGPAGLTPRSTVVRRADLALWENSDESDTSGAKYGGKSCSNLKIVLPCSSHPGSTRAGPTSLRHS